MVRAQRRQTISLLPLLVILLFFSGCAGVDPTTTIGYKPPFLPVELDIDSNGQISIAGSASIVTAVGTFSLTEDIAAKQQTTDTALLVIIRHKQNGSVVDSVYSIQTQQDEVAIVTNGKTTIDVTQHKVFIDASKGNIQSITVKDNSQDKVSNPFGGKLALDDSLSDNSKGFKWDETTDSAGGACKFKDGVYHVSIPQRDDEYCPAEASSFDNFAFQVNMVIVSGDGGGVMFRLDQSLSTGAAAKLYCYEFLISPSGAYSFSLYKIAGSGNTPPTNLRKGSSNAINTGLNQSNLVAVVANGSNITFYVNNQQVDTINDSTYSSGQIAVVAEDLSNPAEVVFSNAKVWKL